MKIGIVSNLYPPYERGGAELVAQRVADALYQRGHDVFVLTSGRHKTRTTRVPRVQERDLATVYRFRPWNIYGMYTERAHSFPARLLWQGIDLLQPISGHLAWRVFRQESPDVIITHNVKGLGMSVFRAIQRSGARHIHTLHDVQLSVPSGLLMSGEERRWLNRGPLRVLYEQMVKRTIGTPDVVVSPSRFLAEFYKDRGFFHETDVRVIPNPAPDSSVPRRPKNEHGAKQFLFVGQLESHKGLHVLMRALSHVREPFILHIAGEGAMSEAIQAWANRDDRVVYHGFVSLGSLMGLFSQVDATIVPSLCYENSPTVIYESFLSGVPVIASDIGGIPELVSVPDAGTLVPPGDVPALARALKKEIRSSRDPDRRMRIRAHGEAYSLDHYLSALEPLLSDKSMS